MKFIASLGLMLLSLNPQPEIHKFFKFFGAENSMADVEAILGPGFTTSSSGLKYTNEEGITLRLYDYDYNRSERKITIDQIGFGSSYINSKENKANPFLGLTTKMTKEVCEAHLKGLPNIKEIVNSLDLNGEYIKFIYTGNPNISSYRGIKVYMRFEKGKKKQLYLKYITISRR